MAGTVTAIVATDIDPAGWVLIIGGAVTALGTQVVAAINSVRSGHRQTAAAEKTEAHTGDIKDQLNGKLTARLDQLAGQQTEQGDKLAGVFKRLDHIDQVLDHLRARPPEQK